MPRLKAALAHAILIASAMSMTPATAATRMATLVQLLPTCPSETRRWADPRATAREEAAPLAAILAPLAAPLVNGAVSWSIGWFVDRQKELAASRTAHAASTLYSPTDKGLTLRNRCLVYVRGEVGDQETFEERKAARSIGQDPLWTTDRIALLRDGVPNEVPGETQARRGAIPLVARPLAYAEFDLDPDRTSNAHYLSIRPHLLDYHATAAERSTSNRKDVLLLVRLDRVGTDQAVARASFAFPDLQVGATYDAEVLGDADLALALLPSQMADGAGAQASDLVPVTASVTLAESEKAGDIELALDQVLSAQREKLSEGAGDSVRKALK